MNPSYSSLVPIVFLITQAVAAFVLAMAITPVYTHFAFKYQLWKRMRVDAHTGEKAKVYQKLHAKKHARNIPTMAGLIFIIAVAVVTIALNWSRSQTYLPVFGLIAAGAVGLLDDIINIRGSSRIAGLRGSIKITLILGVALIAALYFYFRLGYSLIHIPAVGDFELGLLYIPLFIIVIISTSNAVNITDGLDGLAGGLCATAFAAFGVIALVQGNVGIAGFCLAMVGALLAYTWFNIFPARFFMGDSGSFAIGTALGIVAMLTNSVLALVVIGGVFVIETLSSILQIGSKKFFGRKIFRSAPLHHHLEAIGWPEPKITMRLWIIGAICASFGLLVGLIGGG